MSLMFGMTLFQNVVLLGQTAPLLVTVFFTHLLSLTKIEAIRQVLLVMGECEEFLNNLELPLRTPKFLNSGAYSTMLLCLVFGWIQFSINPVAFVIIAYAITMMLLGSISLVVGFIDVLEMVFRRLKIALIKKRHSKQKVSFMTFMKIIIITHSL